MNVEIVRDETVNGHHYITARCNEYEGFVTFRPWDSSVQAGCTRGLFGRTSPGRYISGRWFATPAQALAHYRSPAMQAIIRAAIDLHRKARQAPQTAGN